MAKGTGLRAVGGWPLDLRAVLGHSGDMSDKELALDSIRWLSADASLITIAARLEFLAAIRLGLDQIELVTGHFETSHSETLYPYQFSWCGQGASQLPHNC